ncbi:conserved Plasmodium protein, unknown function [Plasmodium malariae]|uniref:Uncharacterized protein n=1 Tax=Plasmodium malariae TaxID=5858 RepID=A0A1A8X906_PLAMA|nr:conserved Plasmodium protein, unknown function [Plasmodium malariae]
MLKNELNERVVELHKIFLHIEKYTQIEITCRYAGKGVELTGVEFAGIEFARVEFAGIEFVGVELTGVEFVGIEFVDVNSAANCLKKVCLLSPVHNKNKNREFQKAAYHIIIKKNYFNLSTLRKIKIKYRKMYAFQDMVYTNKKKSIINLVYPDMIKKEKKYIADKLKEIIEKQENVRIERYLFLLEKMKKLLLKKLLTKTWFAKKLKACSLSNVVPDLTLFEKRYIWNGRKVSALFKNNFSILNRKLNVLLDRYMQNDKYYYNTRNIKKDDCNKNLVISSPLHIAYALQLYGMFNNNYFLKSINSTTRLININMQFYLLKNYINDTYSSEKILYTYKTFVQLTVKKNMIPLFSSFQDSTKLIKYFESALDEIVKRQLDVDIPNLKIMNLLNFSFNWQSKV